MGTKLEESNLRMIDNIRRFKELEHQLKVLGVHSIDMLEGVRSKANKLGRKYKEVQLQTQRTMLWKVFERLQNERIDRESYAMFYSMVPNELKQRLDRKGGLDRLL